MVRRNSEGGFVVSGPEGVSAYRMLALKSMLKLEMLGMKHSRGSAFATIKREYGLKGSKQSVLAQFEKMCAAVVEHRAKPPGFNPLTRREQGKVLGLAAQAGKRYERYDERNVEDDFYSGSALGKQSAYKHVARRFGPRKSVRKNPGGCYCLIRHAITAAERAQVKKQLDYFRSVGDTRGTMFSVAQLGKCSSSGKTARKNSYAIAYAKVVSGGKAVARVEPYLYKDKKLAGVVARHHQYSGVAHIPGAPDSGNLMVNRKRKRSRYGKAMSEKLRGLALALRHEHEKRRKGSRKNAPNLSTSRHAAATWKAGDAAHKFLSHMDGRNLSLFRDVSMWDFMMGNQKATTARKACAGTVLDRYNQFINVVNALWPQIQKKEISKVPLRIAAGSWGMMEQMRSDF